MQTLSKKVFWFWQNLEKILLVFFFLSFTLNLRKVFITPYSFLNGGFNEYLTISLSWADILIIAIIIIYTINIILRQYSEATKSENYKYNNKHTLSNWLPNSVPHETFFLLLFLAWTGLSIIWSQYKPIASYKFLTLIEVIIFAYVAIKNLNSIKLLKISLFALLMNGLFQSLLGIAQFIHNGSLGLHSIGESIFGPNIDGVAKIIINGEKHIRAYGTFPHPNILAGFLIVPLSILIVEIFTRIPLLSLGKKIEEKSNSDAQSFQLGLSLPGKEDLNNVSRETLFSFLPSWSLVVYLSIMTLGFILTLSRSAFLGLLVGLFFSLVLVSVRRRRGFVLSIGRKAITLFLLFIILGFIFIISAKYTSFFSNQSLQERNIYQNVSYETISRHPIKGIGLGQFILSEFQRNPKLESWQYQPVHNIFLLIFSELGIVGLALFLFFMIPLFWKMQEQERKQKYNLTYLSLYCILLSFLTISLFDHYFWDIKIGTLIFILPFLFSDTMKKWRGLPSQNIEN